MQGHWNANPIPPWQLLLKESQLFTIMASKNTNFPLIVTPSPISKVKNLLSLSSLEPVFPFELE